MEEPRVAIVRTYRANAGNAHARAVMARRVHLRRRMTVEEAFRATMLECLAQSGGNAPAIRARDPEGVHQIRVGLISVPGASIPSTWKAGSPQPNAASRSAGSDSAGSVTVHSLLIGSSTSAASDQVWPAATVNEPVSGSPLAG